MDKIINYYNTFDEWGRLDREPLEYTINMHHIKSNLPDSGHIFDNGAGPGRYSIELARQGYQITLSDLTSRLVDIAKEKATEQQLTEQFNGFHVLDSRDLSMFSNEQFDASLMLGPMYHLQTEEDREKAVTELKRVTKKNGLVFVAFMSRTKFLTTSITHPEFWKPNHTVQGISKFMKTGTFNHSDAGRFTGAYYFNIDEINPFMESYGFKGVKLIGSSSVAGAMNEEQWDYWRDQGNDEFEELMKIVLEESENPYILGTSSHLLYIGRKI